MKQQALRLDRRSPVLPIYEDWLLGVNKQQPLARNPSCHQCGLSERAATICMPGDGEPGGLLVVGKAPAEFEDREGKPFVGASGTFLRSAIGRHWNKPVFYTNAVRCLSSGDLAPKSINACRPYLRADFDAVKPERVLVLGMDACLSVFGESLPPTAIRRAWAYVLGAPAYVITHPAAVLRSDQAVAKRWFENDIKWALTAPIPAQPSGSVIAPQTPEEAIAWISKIKPGDSLAFDCETVGRQFMADFRVVALGMSVRDDEACVLAGVVLNHEGVQASLRRVFDDLSVSKVGHNMKYDIHALRLAFGVRVRGLGADTRCYRRLVESDAPNNLDLLSWLVGMGGYKRTPHAAAKAQGGLRDGFGQIEHDTLVSYCGRDAVTTLKVKEWHEPRLGPMAKTWKTLMAPALDALVQVEEWGVYLSRDTVIAYEKWLVQRMDEAMQKMQAFDAVKQFPGFSPGNQHHVADLLFTRMKIESDARTATGRYRVNKDTLEDIKHPIIEPLLMWRRLEKKRSTYGLGMLEHVGTDGRVHTNFNLDGAASGRLSSDSPNLQNIPRPTSDDGKWSRDCFAATPGNVLVQLDYSQIELRIAAMFSGDAAMIQSFKDGVDFHRKNAGIIFEKPPDAITKEERTTAKSLASFGLLFGKSAASLAVDLGVSERKATMFFDRIWAAYPDLHKWVMKQKDQAVAAGETWTYWNGQKARRRNLVRFGEGYDRETFVGNAAINSPIQGTANEYCLASLTESVRWIVDENVDAKLVLAVHDSLAFDVPARLAPMLVAEVKRIMLGWHTDNDVPLAVDVEIGPSWGSLVTMKT